MPQKCPKCNSKKTRKFGTTIFSGGTRLQRYQCIECGHVFNSDEEVKGESGDNK